MKFEDIDWSAPPPPGGYDVTPAVNAKCILFTLALSLGYWSAPAKNKYVLLCLCIFPYLWLSYYDVAYKAKRNMGPTYLGDFYDWLKVPSSKQVRVFKNWAPKWKRKVQTVDAALAVAILALIPAFIKWAPKHEDPDKDRDNKKALAFATLCVVACVVCRFTLKAE